MDANGATLLLFALLVLLTVCCCCCVSVDQPDRPAESPERRVARALAEWEALAARAEAALAARAVAAAAPVLTPLPYFPYAPRSGVAAECSICLVPLRQWQLCSEVPACRHIFHEECIRAWARKKNTCPLCRARVVLPRAAYGIAAADDIV